MTTGLQCKKRQNEKYNNKRRQKDFSPNMPYGKRYPKLVEEIFNKVWGELNKKDNKRRQKNGKK